MRFRLSASKASYENNLVREFKGDGQLLSFHYRDTSALDDVPDVTALILTVPRKEHGGNFGSCERTPDE